jgi:FtsH-binding integral membrane protein
VRAWIIQHTWASIVVSISFIVLGLALFWMAESYPINMILLVIFTLAASYLIGATVSYYDVVVVAQAFIITLGIFIGLTLFALQTKYDFSGIVPYIYAGLWGYSYCRFDAILFTL